MENITLTPIGLIHTPFATTGDAPRGPSSADGARGRIVVDEKYAAGLRDLEGFSHVIVVFYFDRSTTAPLLVTPPNSPVERGVFATHSPNRPNHLGLSVVRLEKIEGNVVQVRDVDMLDGTPLLDLKPYSAPGNVGEGIRQGWIDEVGGKVTG